MSGQTDNLTVLAQDRMYCTLWKKTQPVSSWELMLLTHIPVRVVVNAIDELAKHQLVEKYQINNFMEPYYRLGPYPSEDYQP